jgi:amidase
LQQAPTTGIETSLDAAGTSARATSAEQVLIERTETMQPGREFRPGFATAEESARAILTKKVSATELLTETLRRVDEYNPKINAIIWQDREKAMARARQADEAMARGEMRGALHGVPITIKESFAYQGSANSWGIPPLKNAISPRTAVAVEKLEAAGAIVIGKTNVAVMLGDWQSANPNYGVTNNPWDVTRTAGGSTGGGAAALAAGLGCIELGSDVGGSIRVPSHFCGVYGHKPSLGLVDASGHQPGPWDGGPGLLLDMAATGPMARSAVDLCIGLEVIGGAGRDEAKAWTWRMPAARQKKLRDFRIGYVMDDASAPVASDVGAVYANVLRELERAGAKLERGWPQGIVPMEQGRTFYYLLMAFMSFGMDDAALERSRAKLAQDPNDIPAMAAVGPHKRWLEATQQRMRFRAMWQKYFESHDVFLMPTAFTAAIRHDHSQPMEKRVVETKDGPRPYQELSRWISYATVAGLPATTAPVGLTAEGLPVGMQIVAPMWEDGTGIEFARLLGEVVGGFREPARFQNRLRKGINNGPKDCTRGRVVCRRD